MIEDFPYTAPALARFDHVQNVAVGLARVIFAEACHPRHGLPCLRGWVLPGGHRTTDRELAVLAASRMDKAMRAGYHVTPN